jgi:hypothetical protein
VASGPVGSLSSIGVRFIGGDRKQVFLMPPLVTDWVPEDHLVWMVLEAVGALDFVVGLRRLSCRRARAAGV